MPKETCQMREVVSFGPRGTIAIADSRPLQIARSKRKHMHSEGE